MAGIRTVEAYRTQIRMIVEHWTREVERIGAEVAAAELALAGLGHGRTPALLAVRRSEDARVQTLAAELDAARRRLTSAKTRLEYGVRAIPFPVDARAADWRGASAFIRELFRRKSAKLDRWMGVGLRLDLSRDGLKEFDVDLTFRF